VLPGATDVLSAILFQPTRAPTRRSRPRDCRSQRLGSNKAPGTTSVPSASQEPLADEAGDENTLEASGNDGSDEGEDAGLAAIGAVTTVALGAGDAGRSPSLLLQPRSAAAHTSAQRAGMRFIEVPSGARAALGAAVPPSERTSRQDVAPQAEAAFVCRLSPTAFCATTPVA